MDSGRTPQRIGSGHFSDEGDDTREGSRAAVTAIGPLALAGAGGEVLGLLSLGRGRPNDHGQYEGATPKTEDYTPYPAPDTAPGPLYRRPTPRAGAGPAARGGASSRAVAHAGYESRES